MLSLLAAVSLSVAAPLQDYSVPANANPTLNLSAVRHIVCDNWSGSGFLIGKRQMLTANHVLDGGENCRDEASGSGLMIYKQDKAHDVVLATGPLLPTDIPYIKISCQPFLPDQPYMAYGVSRYWQTQPILRENTIVATKRIEDFQINLGDHIEIWKGMRYFDRPTSPGMSGGPVVDLDGYAHAVVNAGSPKDTLLFQFSDGMLCRQ